MALRCGIVGLPNVGKSVIFNALTNADAEAASFPYSTVTPNVGMVPVPDDRLERIHAFIETKKVVHAELQIVDIAGLPEGASRGEGMGNKFLGHIKEMDALVTVLRFFVTPDLDEKPGENDPILDIEIVETELALADLETTERNLDRVKKKAKSGDKEAKDCEILFQRIIDTLVTGAQARNMELTDRERQLLRPLFLLTAKPMLYVANVSDTCPAELLKPNLEKLAAHAQQEGSQMLGLAGLFEAEIIQLSPQDRAEFMADAGQDEPGLNRLIQAAYHLLGLRTFLTAGDIEIKAWTFRAGDKAPQAAAVIHSDFEKKFIRAEIYTLADLEEHKTESAIRSAGKLRVLGKDYEMADGDIAHFLIGN